MATYTMAREIAERLVFRLPASTTGAELSKALSAAYQAAEARNSTIYDDTLLIEADDAEIRIILDTKPWASAREE